MKKNKKLNSIATMSKEELQEVNGGMRLMWWCPDVFPLGIPNPVCSASLTPVLNQSVSGMNSKIMNIGKVGY